MGNGDLPPAGGSRPEETLENGGGDARAGGEENPEPSNAAKKNQEVPLEGSDSLARAISSVLGGVMRDFDSRAEGAARSQDELSRSLDRLTGELDKLLEDAPSPFLMQHAAKISGVRKRVSALNSILRSIQRRIDNIDMMLSTALPHEKAVAEVAGQHQS